MGPPPRKRAWVEAEHNAVNESARLTFVSELSSDGPYVGRRVRTCGWLIAVEPKTSLVLLEHNGHGVLVDLTRALESDLGGVPRLKALLTIFGELESIDPADHRSLDPQVSHAMSPVDESVRLRATGVIVEDSLDIKLWVESVAALRLED